MPPTSLRSFAASAVLLLCASGALADTIYKVDGTALSDVEVVNETLTSVTYKSKGKSGEQAVAADQVLDVEYTKVPRLIDEAEALAAEGALADAVDRLELFAEGVLSGENKRDRQAWAPGYALRRAHALRLSQGDLDGAVATADKLIKRAPESRYVPHAYVAKIEAQRSAGKSAQALATVKELRELVASKSLSRRWTLEADLAEVLSDPQLQGVKKRDRLIEIAGEAGSELPIVRNRARVAEGESYLEGEKKDFAKARDVFQKIVADPKADPSTLAGAYTGMGDVLFQEAADKIQAQQDASEILRKALQNYMRVVVVYEDQARYVPKAMYYAGRSAEFLDDEASRSRARKLYTSVIQQYPGTTWAVEAKSRR